MRIYLTVCAALLSLPGACKSDTEASSSGSGGPSTTTGSAGAGGSEWPWLPAQHAACPSSGCPAPLQCISYCGFAGCTTGGGGSGGSTSSGEISSCEIPCDPTAPNCPAGEICVNIADGPGDVCSMP